MMLKVYVNIYLHIHRWDNKSFKDKDVGVNYADFPRKNTIFVFNLTPDLSDEPYFNLAWHENFGVEADFSQNLVQAVTCVVHAEYDSMLEINTARNVVPDYGA